LIIRNAGIILFPLTAVAVVCLPLAGPDLAFGRFDALAAESLAMCLAAFSVGFFADMASNTLFQALLSLGRVRVLLWLSLFASFLPNIILNLVLMRTLGTAGLALSTSIVGYLTLFANYLVLRRSVPFNNERSMWMSVGSSLLCACVAGATAFIAGQTLHHWIDGQPFAGLWSAILAAVVCLVFYAVLVFVYPGLKDAKRLRSTLAFMRRR
jgi:putative peptidoglycan lipid II flippase